jgi:threonine aldolase
LVDEARVWQVRHGGRMFSVHPLLVAAERGLDEVLPRMPAYVEHTRALGAALAAIEDVSVVPDPPQVAMLHVHVRRPLERLRQSALDVAEERGVWLGRSWTPTEDPAVQRTELSIGEDALEVAPGEAAELYCELLERSRDVG